MCMNFEGETWKGRYKQRATFKVRNSPISNGDSFYGIIDENGKLYLSKGDNLIPEVVPFKSKVISVSCATYYVGAVTEDGSAYLWGYLDYFDADLKSSNTPVKLKLPGKALKISCGYGDLGGIPSTIFAVILDDLSVYFRGKFTDLDVNVSERFYLEARDIYTGQNFVAMINLDNQLYYWGALLYGSGMNNPYYDYDSTHIAHPCLFSFSEPIKQVAFGEFHVIILSTKGEVYTMGSNEDGKLGRPILDVTGDDFFDLSKLDLHVPIVSISTGASSAAVISETGKLFVWGENTIATYKSSDYQRNKIVLPTEVDIGSPINYVDVNDFSFIAVTQDGAVNLSGKFKLPE